MEYRESGTDMLKTAHRSGWTLDPTVVSLATAEMRVPKKVILNEIDVESVSPTGRKMRFAAQEGSSHE